jgi:hypothetical protein
MATANSASRRLVGRGDAPSQPSACLTRCAVLKIMVDPFQSAFELSLGAFKSFQRSGVATDQMYQLAELALLVHQLLMSVIKLALPATREQPFVNPQRAHQTGRAELRKRFQHLVHGKAGFESDGF